MYPENLYGPKLLIVGMKPLYICSYYRSLMCNSDLEPLLELRNFLTSYLMGNKFVSPHFVLTGDFNLPDIIW